MNKSEHEGICQVRGRQQALPNGAPAKHGYTVEYGYFEGVCPGSHYGPLELTRERADEIAKELHEQATTQSQSAVDFVAGRSVPFQAWNGEYKKVTVTTRRGSTRTMSERVMVPFAEASEQYQRRQVQEIVEQLQQRAALATSCAKGITQRADKITGKQALVRRADEAKKEIKAGTIVHLYGKDGFDVTVLRVETRVARGCGPFMNGNAMPHIVFMRNEKEHGYPVRLIRQAAIM